MIFFSFFEFLMQIKRKDGVALGLWDVSAIVIAGLLFLDFLGFLVLLVVGIGLLLVYALEIGVVTSVLLLLGCAVYFAGKNRGLQKRWRRFLLGAVFAGGIMILFFCVVTVAMIVYTVSVLG